MILKIKFVKNVKYLNVQIVQLIKNNVKSVNQDTLNMLLKMVYYFVSKNVLKVQSFL